MNNLTPEDINRLLKYAVGGYWSALQENLFQLECNNTFDSSELRQELNKIRRYQDEFQTENQSLTNPHMIVDYMKTRRELTTSQEKITQLETELTTFLTARKQTLQQEINLIKEVLRE